MDNSNIKQIIFQNYQLIAEPYAHLDCAKYIQLIFLGSAFLSQNFFRRSCKYKYVRSCADCFAWNYR